MLWTIDTLLIFCLKARIHKATFRVNQLEIPIHSTLHLIGSRRRLLQTVARKVALCTKPFMGIALQLMLFLYKFMWIKSLNNQVNNGIFHQQPHTEKSFRNLIKSTRNQIVFTIFRLIWIQTNFRLDLNQSKNGKYNLISGWFNKIWVLYAWSM